MSVSGIAKAGWLFRQSSVLHRWKKYWFVLYTDGMLRYFESQNNYTPEGAILLKFECVEVLSGKESKADSIPEGKDRESLFSLVFLTQGLWHLCAENSDDRRAWTWAINDMRQGGPRAAANYPAQTGVATPHLPYPPQTVVYNNPTVIPAMAPQTIVYSGDPLFGPHYGRYPYNSYYYGSGLSAPFGRTLATPGAVLHTNGAAPIYPYNTTMFW